MPQKEHNPSKRNLAGGQFLGNRTGPVQLLLLISDLKLLLLLISDLKQLQVPQLSEHSVDAIVALMGIVYCGQDGYLVRRDSCFY